MNKIAIRSKSIFLLYPSQKLEFIKDIQLRLKKEPYGFKTVYLMQYEDQKQTEATLAHKFDKIYEKSDFVFAFFFDKITNISVNFEIGFIHGKKNHKLIEHFLVLSELGLDFSNDNPYLSSGKSIAFGVADFKEVYPKYEEYLDSCKQINAFIVNHAKPKKNNKK